MDFNNLPSILTPDPGLLFWMFLAFVVVLVVLAKFGLPAMIDMVDKRKNFIDESLQKAQEANDRLDNIKKESEALIQEAREKQASIMNEAMATRDEIVAKAQDKAREESARILKEAKAEIEVEKQAAIQSVRRQVAELSVEISGKILRTKLQTDKAQMDYIDHLLDEVTVTDK